MDWRDYFAGHMVDAEFPTIEERIELLIGMLNEIERQIKTDPNALTLAKQYGISRLRARHPNWFKSS